MQQDNDRDLPDSQPSNHVDVIKAQGKRIVALEGEVIDLKRENKEQKNTIIMLETKVDRLTATVIALAGQQGHVIVVADNAALNADNAAHRAEQQHRIESPVGEFNHQEEIAGENRAVRENLPGEQDDAGEMGVPNPSASSDKDDHSLDDSTANLMQ